MDSLPRKPESPLHATAMIQPFAASEAGFAASVAGAAQTPARAVSRRLPEGLAAAIAHTLFAVLITIDVIRTLHHPMWRDEFQTYSIGLYSPSFGDLLINMWGFGHPALLYILEWLVTRVTSDPTAIQIMQLGLALGVWIIVYVYSPFSHLEKILLLLSYFLFWEYFVISRNYVLIALIAFAFIALRERRPRPEFALWLLLGLLANAHAYAAIWSIVLAAGLAMETVRRRPVPVYVPIAGAVVYLLLLAFAIVMMQPPPWYSLSSPVVQFSIPRLFADAETPVGAFVPLSVATVRQAIAYIAHPDSANIPNFFDANSFNEILVLIQATSEHPMRLAIIFAPPVVACWLLTRNWLLTLEFSLVYLGIVLFENIWNFPGSARHHGVVFLALVAAVWSARSRQTPDVWSRWLFAGILFVNACGGVTSLASELRPFSESYETAAWIKQNDFANAFLIGSHDAQVSSVAGYLGRPVYYLECACLRPYGIWNYIKGRHGRLTAEEFASRLAEAVALAGQREAILIRNGPVTADDLKPGASNLTATLLKSFTNASTDENYWIYRLSAHQAP
jgi:hypothetical protein